MLTFAEHTIVKLQCCIPTRKESAQYSIGYLWENEWFVIKTLNLCSVGRDGWLVFCSMSIVQVRHEEVHDNMDGRRTKDNW